MKTFPSLCPSNLPFGIRKVSIIQLSYDGINCYQSGVGTVVQQTNQVLSELNAKYLKKFHIKLFLMTPNYINSSPKFSFKILKKSIISTFQTGGDVFLLSKTKSDEYYGPPEDWKKVCEQAVMHCVKIIEQSPYTLVLAHDTVFAQVPLLLKKYLKNRRIDNRYYQAIWIPHATSWAYDGHVKGIANWKERHDWEMEAFRGSLEFHYPIGYIGKTIQNYLQDPPFCMPKSHLVPFQTGIILDSFLKSLSLKSIIEELKRRSIPLDRRLIFSIGRATPEKGQDIVLEMFCRLLPDYPDLHLVFLAQESNLNSDFIKLLKRRSHKEKLQVTILDSFDADFAPFVYQWPLTAMVALFSRVDTKPLTVMEARANPKNCVVFASNQEGMGEQIKDGIDGFISEIKGLPPLIKSLLLESEVMDRIVEKAKMILDMEPEKRDQIIQRSKALIQKDYNLRKEMISNLNRFIKDIDIPLDEKNGFIHLDANGQARSDSFDEERF